MTIYSPGSYGPRTNMATEQQTGGQQQAQGQGQSPGVGAGAGGGMAQQPQQGASGVPQGVAGAPNEQALLDLMSRTGFTMIQENGQRKYGGPPPGWEGVAPARGCEVFVGKIPRDCYEDELVPVFERIGRIYELRLMMDFSGSNRGYCFVMYTSKGDAARAVRELNNFEVRKGRFLGVCLSVDNCRLFVGGIPKNKQREEILGEMVKVTEGVVDVIVYPSAQDKTKNRGFAFVEYESHRAAAMARRKLIPGRIQLWGHQIAVDWAEPEQEVDDDVMAKVKILYVRNLMLTTTEEVLHTVFSQACSNEKAVERVKKIRDYAFVHFREREDALTAMARLNNSMLEGSKLEVVLAKPVDKNDYIRYTRGGGRGAMTQAGVTFPGYELAFNPAATFLGFPGTATAAGIPGITGSHLGVRTAGRGRGRGAAGSRGAGGRGFMPMRNPYRKHPAEERLYDLSPEMVLTPTNPITLKPQALKSPVQVLEELCIKNGWGIPIYQLHSTMHRDATEQVQLFLYKISIPTLTGQYPNSTFSPGKLCRSVEEAKLFAAEHTLLQLGIPLEGDAPSQSLVTSQSSAGVPAASMSPQTATSVYQGRPIAPAYPLTNGTIPAPRSELVTYATSIPPVVTTTSYVMPAGKMPPPLPAQTAADLAAYTGAFPAATVGYY